MDLKMEVYTPALELIGFLEIQKSVIWEEKAFAAGSFSVESLITDESLSMLQPENIIWIESETAGIIEYVQEEAGENGPYITVKGHTLTGILDRRILWGLYSLKGTPPDIMHYLVDDCCIHPTRGNVEARKIPGLVMMDAAAGGVEIQFQKTGGSLLDALNALGETYGVAFGVRFNPAVPQMEFWTRWGNDRSIYQSENDPVLYSTELDDVLSSEYLYNSQDYRNVALVAGEGEGADRVFVTVEHEDETPDVPMPPVPPEPPVAEKYTVTLLVDPAGGGSASGGKTVAAGVSITVTAAPSDGYEFVGWQENGITVSVSQSYTFTVTANRILTAVFAAIIPTCTVTVIVDPAGYGTVTGAGRYKEGDTVTLKAAAGDGYQFTEWREGASAVHSGETYTFTASRDVTLTAVFAVKPSSRLPAGYTELQYIQSSGAQSIDTEMKPVKTTKIFIDVEPTSNGTSNNSQYFFCSNYVTASYIDRYAVLWLSGGVYADMGYGSTLSAIRKQLSPNNTARRMTLQMDIANKTAKIDNDPEVTFSNNTIYSGIYNIRLLSYSSSQYFASAKLYSCKIFEGDTPVRDFVPCKAPSGDIGLYDLVGRTFYSNAGTGAFTAGPAV